MAYAELAVDDRRVVDDDHPFASGRAVVIDKRHLIADQRGGELRRVGDGRRAEDEGWVAAVELAYSPQPPEDVGQVASENAAVGVQLIDDHVVEALEELHPFGVVGEDRGVQHVRVGEDDVPGGTHRPAGVGGRVAVVGEGADLFTDIRDQPVQFVELVLGERLCGEEIERARRAILQDRVQHRCVVTERLAAGRRRDHDRVAAIESEADRLGLVSVGLRDAPALERCEEPRVERFRPLAVARRALIDAAHDGIGRFRLQFGDHGLGDDRGRHRAHGGHGISGRRLNHGRVLSAEC